MATKVLGHLTRNERTMEHPDSEPLGWLVLFASELSLVVGDLIREGACSVRAIRRLPPLRRNGPLGNEAGAHSEQAWQSHSLERTPRYTTLALCHVPHEIRTVLNV